MKRTASRHHHVIQLHQRGGRRQRQQNQDEKEAFHRAESEAVPSKRAHSECVNVGRQSHGKQTTTTAAAAAASSVCVCRRVFI